MRNQGCIFGLMLLGLAAQGFGQSAPTTPPIVTDRPSYSDGNTLILPGYLQFETGLTSTMIPGGNVLDFGELYLRYGLSSKWEIRYVGLQYDQVAGGNGWTDSFLGVKYDLADELKHRPAVTLEFLGSVPQGTDGYRVNRFQSSARVLLQKTLSTVHTLGSNVWVSDIGPTGQRFTQYSVTLFDNVTLSPRAGVFVEAYGVLPEAYQGPNAFFGDVGIQYLLNSQLQVDFRVGSGLDESRDGWYVGAGLSWRFDLNRGKVSGKK